MLKKCIEMQKGGTYPPFFCIMIQGGIIQRGELMQELVELTYVITIMIGVMSFTMQVMTNEKNLAVSNDMAKSKSLAGFLAIIVIFNTCDFLMLFLEGVISNYMLSWFYIVENMLEIALAYQLIIIKANLSKRDKAPWVSVFFALTAVVILMLDIFYTTEMIVLSDNIYMMFMVILNILPLAAVAYFSINYRKLSKELSIGRLTDFYLVIYDIAFIFLCFVATISMVDARTTYDYFANDKAIYAIFWLVFNTLNAIFVWNSCRVVEINDLSKEESIEKLFDKATEKFALSAREREIALLLYEGKNNNEIAEILFLSTNTIKVHASNLYKKLGVSNRVQAIKVIQGEEIKE